ncbi:MAG: MetQ/NlpA family ABC transporter substrate-binding protein [Cellulosilyticaceae bacterium]
MKKFIKSLAITLVGATLLTSLVGCGSSDQTAQSTNSNQTTLKIGASAVPHAEILEFAKPLLAEKGIDLKIQVFTDYILPNTALDSGELDANFFQHGPYLDDFNAKNGTKIVSAGAIHFEPLGLYPGKTASITDLKEGASIAIPSDVTNEARALALLEAEGLITLNEGAGLSATPKDIAENPHNIKFVELEAAQVPRALPDVDFGVANGNYALEADIAETVLASESKDSEGAQTFANIIAVQEGKENDPTIKVLLEVLQSDAVRTFINDTYKGLVVPMF